MCPMRLMTVGYFFLKNRDGGNSPVYGLCQIRKLFKSEAFVIGVEKRSWAHIMSLT